MDGSPVDASDIEVEVARDTEPPSDYYSLDTTLFFETVELHDERPHLLKTVNGETIRINPSEEVDVDAFLAQQLHTSRNGDKSVHSEFEDSEVEVPRGAGLEQTKLHSGVESEVFPSCASEQL
ncbi:hypothetical protein Y032_0280g1215 [Ancylostoma ceylanicum]|uniref:Uncharacterized protein n=1 Tax=Ancylostoma ceylanicum TaxID=53326 RepID=A0A016S7A7_9BILA|nr:hypothetical protein Y032_0280g1215 [Ancylostoma ceylanicum]